MSDIEEQLAARIHGSVHRPGSGPYDEQRAGFQLLDPHEPQVVVAAADAADIQLAVRCAAEHGQPIAVQASGHGRVGALRGGVLIATGGMSAVQVDPAERTAWVQAGASWRQVIEAAAPYGLAPLSGSSPGVGAAGYTLGGGVGLLAREHGFAADHVRRIDLVTPDGQLRAVDAESDPELFWALRGGGGGFGVVTRIQVELVPLTHLYGGGLFIEVDRQPDVLARWAQWSESVPEQLTSAVSMLQYPDLPFVPGELRGRHVANLQVSYAGPAAQGERWVEPLRKLQPFRDTLRRRPYTESGKIFDEPDRPHPYRSQNRLLHRLPAAALAQLTDLAGPAAPAMCIVGLRHLGGSLRRPPAQANAVGHRDAAYSLTVLSPVDPDQRETAQALHTDAMNLFAGHELGRSLNFSYGPLSPEQVAEAFEPADHERLVRLRDRLDPDRLIRTNHPL